ncbi:hypothetical protein Lal_00000700, partial [Lupinus albus]
MRSICLVIIVNLNNFYYYSQTMNQHNCGNPSQHTLKFQGLIGGQPVNVLVDTCSSHIVMQPIIAQFLKITISPTPQFPIMVGIRKHIFYTRLCTDN